MPNYMLVLRDRPEDFATITPEDIQRIIQKYSAWAEKLAKEGRLVAGEKLMDGEGRIMRRGKRPLAVTDGPFTEGKEVLGGFFTIKAASMDEAVKVAEGCPHLDFGGSLEVREVEDTSAGCDSGRPA